MVAKRRVRKLTRTELADPERQARSQRQAEARKDIYSASHRLPRKQREFILNVAANAWVAQLPNDVGDAEFENESRRWEKLRSKFLREATNPLELHLFACSWNCDGGIQPIYRIVTSPYCDAGTALWLYWENDPYFAMAFRTINDAKGWEQPFVRLSRSIERRFLRNDFRTTRISFDPEPWVTDRYDSAEWVAHKIPDVMYHPTGPKKRRSHK